MAKVDVLEIKDNLGTHSLNSNCFVVKCAECKKERDLLDTDIDDSGKISPKNCKCGGKNKFHYWLDSIYTEEEYKELELKELKNGIQK